MANSSEWIQNLAASGSGQPVWLSALTSPAEFAEGPPFARKPLSMAPEPPPAEPEAAIAKAREEGEAAGRAAAQAEYRKADENRRALQLAFRALDQAAMDALAAELTETVIELCGQVLSECAIEKQQLSERARAAAMLLGGAPEHMKLRLHPDDIGELGHAALEGMQCVADPELPRGSLRLESPDGEVHDGPDQWRRAIAEALRG
ncbi:FliH/SctL family protein [Erythrobacter sp. THAF29]|uniref:FliH/SctL family protein n=1 Tax=Erythrobacter sp. THAF29 TaxID=2587851 RepID=UPI001268BE3F|nr:FliH/SctL family protein [Erythrobacter sp. THAF29]QFT76707.1 flagellar assembly protein H [Erythrobacter sp. THAF29]